LSPPPLQVSAALAMAVPDGLGVQTTSAARAICGTSAEILTPSSGQARIATVALTIAEMCVHVRVRTQ